MQKRIKRLAMSKKPTKKSFGQTAALWKEHQTPKPNKIAKCFQFSMKGREDVEFLSQYFAELRCLTEHCDYGD